MSGNAGVSVLQSQTVLLSTYIVACRVSRTGIVLVIWDRIPQGPQNSTWTLWEVFLCHSWQTY